MIIKNFVTPISELDYFINILIQELCLNKIPYLYIKESNELHFDKYIYRFHTLQITLDIKLEKPYIPQMLEEIESIAKDDNLNLISEDIPISIDEKPYLKHNKNNIKKLNKQYNLRIKDSYKTTANQRRK